MSIRSTMTASDLKLVPPGGLTPQQLETWNNAYDAKNNAFKEAKLEGDDLIRWKYQRYIKDYLRCVASVDDNVGRVLDYLDESGLAENTVVIYSSDQGFYLGDHGWFDKRFMYEESYRMPFFVRWPDKIKPGTVNHNLVSNLDFAETFLDIAGADIPADMQGKSLKPLVLAAPSDAKNLTPPPTAISYNRNLVDCTQPDFRDALYYHYYEFEANRRTAHMVRRHCGLRTGTQKLIHFYNLDEWEFYDLEKDAREMRSLYDDPEFAETIAAMKVRMAELQKQYDVPDDAGSVPADPPSMHIDPNAPKPGRQNAKKKKAA